MQASLTAVRAAQAETQARNRRETLKARLAVATAAVTFGLGVVALKTRAAHRSPSARPAVAAPIAPAAEPTTTALAASSVAAPPAPVEAPAPEPLAAATAEAPTTGAAANAGAVDECTMLSKRHRWRDAAASCALAVQARPNDASLVLALAQSEHARNRLAEAGDWAKRAIALDPSLAEAFVIRAHAESSAGNRAAAARDFRRYLALAPHGWHAREARAALRVRQERADATAGESDAGG